MAQTIPGGAYLAADGTTWQDANGRALEGEPRANAERLHREQQEQRIAQERARAAQTLDPVALVRAFAGAQPASVPATDADAGAAKRAARS